MRISLLVVLLFSTVLLFSQERNSRKSTIPNNSSVTDSAKAKKPEATIDMYRVITLERDTTYIDTSLTIQRKYSHNYLRKDLFGLLPFPNEGQTYNTLQYSLTSFSPLPEFGFKAKHFNFLEANQIRYCSVATPVTEFFFKTIMKRGQNLDAFFTLNTSPRLNFSIAYKGLRSEGKYINQLTSTGNFRFTTSYNTKNKRYFANFHYTGQDILNEENGGITTVEDFESGNPAFLQRDRLEVYLTDAQSLLKGKRVFLDHFFRINSVKGNNNLYVTHQFNYENKFFEFKQPTVNSIVGGKTVVRFGDSYKNSGINDQTHYNKTYNKVGLTYENTTLGKFNFFVDDFFSNYYYNQILIKVDETVPAFLSRRIDSYGGQYDYRKNKWTGKFLFTRSITNQSLSNLDAKMQYELNEEMLLSFQYQNVNKLPNDNYNLYQSSYVNYNWSNDFKNEKINSISATATTPWVSVAAQYSIFNDHLYFADVSDDDQIALQQQIIAPSQYANTINYLSVKASNEFKFGKFALDNTILYQKVGQSELILNVPEFVTRNTLYYSQNMFKKALFFQTGVTFNYFTSYYGNEYNPVIGEFFVQNQKKMGDFTNFDFFFNARIQRTRIYLTLEHLNSSLSGYNYLSSPNNPYTDFIIRFGLVWNFFQ
ncbi:putative porin [Flavobacterium sp.]|uniref:putative porin n=1 Tax=Flavobacterium sp. TaxID=239 RepID=UPI00286DCDD6|nr:putative porin [Flavobacterium sp.]